jgi:hypothetical protein
MLGSIILLAFFYLFCTYILPEIIDYQHSQQESTIQSKLTQALQPYLEMHDLEIKRNAQAHSARCKRLEECYEQELRKNIEFYEDRIEVLKEHQKQKYNEILATARSLETQNKDLQQQINKLSTPEHMHYRKTIEQLKKEKNELSKQFNQYIVNSQKKT